MLPQQGSRYSALHQCCLQPSAPISKKDTKLSSPGTRSIKSLIDEAPSLRVMLRCQPWGISPIGLAAWSYNDHIVRLLGGEVVSRWKSHKLKLAAEQKSNNKKMMQRWILQRTLGDNQQHQRWPPDWKDVDAIEAVLIDLLANNPKLATLTYFNTQKRLDLMIDMLLEPKPIPSSSSSSTSTATPPTSNPRAAEIPIVDNKDNHDDGGDDDNDDDDDSKRGSGNRTKFRSTASRMASFSELIDERIAFILDDERQRFEDIFAQLPPLRCLPPVLLPILAAYCL
jgi:hypothetical protein